MNLMMGRPLVIIAVSFASGIAAAYQTPADKAWLVPAGLFAAGVLLFVLLLRAGHDHSIPHLARMQLLLLVLSFFLLGLAWGQLYRLDQQSALMEDLHTHLILVGRVSGPAQTGPDRTTYILQAREVRQGNWRKPVAEKVQVVVLHDSGKENPLYHSGDILGIYGMLELPMSARNPGEFDYRGYLARQGIFTRMMVGPDSISRMGAEPAVPWTRMVELSRDRAVQALQTSLPDRDAAVFTAVLLGDTEKLNDNDVQVYRSLGVYHIFAVSGQQVAYVLLAVFFFCAVLRLNKWQRLISGAAVVLFYMALTGFSPSVTRAGTMSLVGLTASTLGEENDPTNALAAAALVILIWKPYELLGPGFQLSFLATWGLINLYPCFNRLLAFLPGWRSAIAVTLAAQTAVQWHIIYYFNLVSAGSLAANLLVLPAIGAVTILGLAVLAISLFSPALAGLVALPGGAILHLLTSILEIVAGIRGLSIAVARPPTWTGAVYLAGLIVFQLVWRRRAVPGVQALLGRLAPLLMASVFILSVFMLLVLPQPRDLELVFLDVGQGDATFIRTPEGRNLLIDGGGRPVNLEAGRVIGEKIVLPYLQRRGIRRLDLVISTHPDGDHLQGLYPVLEQIPATLVVVPPPAIFQGQYSDFLEFLERRGIACQQVFRGCDIRVASSVLLQVLNPDAEPEAHSGTSPGTSGGQEGNNASVVTRLSYGRYSFLLTGDIEAETMTNLLHEYGSSVLNSAVLKIPHHGSAHGLEKGFLEAVSPQAVVIQVGEHNQFGHPAKAVLDYWQAKNVPVYRTDLQGAITVRTDGNSLDIEPFLASPSK